MTFEDKAEIVISQLRADRDRLQNAIDNIRAEIANLVKTYPFIDHKDAYVKEDEVLEIIDKHIKGVSDAQEL